MHTRKEQKDRAQVAGLGLSNLQPAAPPEQKRQILPRSPGGPPRVWAAKPEALETTPCYQKDIFHIEEEKVGLRRGRGSSAWRGPQLYCRTYAGEAAGRQVQRQHWACEAALRVMRWRMRRMRWTSPEWPGRARAPDAGVSPCAERRPAARAL